jgi:hypothetical protein
MTRRRKPTITRADSDKIRKAQVASILKRLQAGHTITAAQQKLLDSETEQPKTAVETEKVYTVHELSRVLDKDPKTLQKAIAKAGLEPVIRGGHKCYRKIEVEKATESRASISDELRAARLRIELAEATRMERDNLEADRELIRMDEAQAMFSASMLPIRQRFLSLASECCSLTNPTDPAFAFRALDNWATQAMRLVSEKLPQVKAGEAEEEIQVAP